MFFTKEKNYIVTGIDDNCVRAIAITITPGNSLSILKDTYLYPNTSCKNFDKKDEPKALNSCKLANKFLIGFYTEKSFSLYIQTYSFEFNKDDQNLQQSFRSMFVIVLNSIVAKQRANSSSNLSVFI